MTDNIVGDGINVGSYAPNASVWVTFDVVIDGPFPTRASKRSTS